MKKIKSGIAYVSRMREKINTYTIPRGISEDKNVFTKPRHRRENNITVDFKETEFKTVHCIKLAQDKPHWRVLSDYQLPKYESNSCNARALIIYG
jgi:hypothetical protein